MGIFNRESPKPNTGNAADDKSLSELANAGYKPDEPLNWEHFVFCDNETGAATLEARSRKAGWETERLYPTDHGVIARRSDLPVNSRTVPDARRFFENLASSVPGGDYDGWGASAARPPN